MGMASPERWAPVRGFEGRYEVSDRGRIRSVERRVRKLNRDGSDGTKIMRSQILKTHTWGAKYPGIVLLAADGSRTRKMVHVMVAEAFVLNPHGWKQVNHLDADTFNAAASNLEWCDQSRNVAHAYALGRRPVGKRHHFASLPRDERGRCMKEAA